MCDIVFNKIENSLNIFGRCDDRKWEILNILAERKKYGISQKELSNKFDSSKVNRVLESFEKTGIIKIEKKKVKGRNKRKLNFAFITNKGLFLYHRLKNLNESLDEIEPITLKEEHENWIEEKVNEMVDSEDINLEIQNFWDLISYEENYDVYPELYENKDLIRFLERKTLHEYLSQGNEIVKMENKDIKSDYFDLYIKLIIKALENGDSLWIEKENERTIEEKNLFKEKNHKFIQIAITFLENKDFESDKMKKFLKLLLDNYYGTTKTNIPNEYLERFLNKFMGNSKPGLDFWKKIILEHINNKKDKEHIKYLIERELEKDDIERYKKGMLRGIYRSESYISIIPSERED